MRSVTLCCCVYLSPAWNPPWPLLPHPVHPPRWAGGLWAAVLPSLSLQPRCSSEASKRKFNQLSFLVGSPPLQNRVPVPSQGMQRPARLCAGHPSSSPWPHTPHCPAISSVFVYVCVCVCVCVCVGLTPSLWDPGGQPCLFQILTPTA